jgi:hypothetical protein
MSTDKPSFSMLDCNKLQQKNSADMPMERHIAGNNGENWAVSPSSSGRSGESAETPLK